MYYHDLDTAEMPLPENLKLVAGNAHNQDLSQVDLWDAAPEWFCDGEVNIFPCIVRSSRADCDSEQWCERQARVSRSCMQDQVALSLTLP